jgi:His-Xaa-Ser repeat protein HxsA
LTIRGFIIPSLILAGFTTPAPGKSSVGETESVDDRPPEPLSALKLFRKGSLIQLAGHSSHRSHSSHSSHRSSSGGGYYNPAPLYTPPPPPPPTYRPPPYTPPSTLYSSPSNPTTSSIELFTTIARRVQTGLQAFGYYAGSIDGVVGPSTKDAIRNFQGDYGLKVTGTITPEVLTALKISVE